MRIFREIKGLQQYLDRKRKAGTSVGFVPTMGALHNGHLSLLGQSADSCGLTVFSIFVNPTQFNNPEDLEKYPRDEAADLRKLTQAGCDVVFMPSVQEMYPRGAAVAHSDYGVLTNSLEGAFRPGHFDGVIHIVRRLLQIVQPDSAFFGQKDFQQCAVIAELVEREKMPVNVVVCPTVREEDGLAMSSRNRRLTAEQRKDALGIYRTLKELRAGFATGNVQKLVKDATTALNAGPLRVEYLGVADASSLQPVTRPEPGQRVVALVAAWCGQVRLIDNMFLND